MFEKELNIALKAGKKASEIVLDFYNNGFEVEIKEDDSPVTTADKASDKIIREIIGTEFPNHSFLTEESTDDLSRIDKEFVWIVDPIDGTKDFVGKDGQFTINIALCHYHTIVLGVVIAPYLDETFYAVKGEGAYLIHNGKKEKIHVNSKTSNLTCLTSIYHLNDLEIATIEKHKDKITQCQKIGASLKACYIGCGRGEITYRFSPNTKEWDTAAPQIILEEAGGLFLEPDGSPITYNRADVYNRKGYIAVNKKENFIK